MRPFPYLPSFLCVTLSLLMLNVAVTGLAATQENRPAPSAPQQPPQNPQPQDQQSQAQQPQDQQPEEPQGPQSNYDRAIFQNPIPSDQLDFLKQFDGAAARDLARDKQFRKLMRAIVPACMFHYGHDMPLSEAMDVVLNDSSLPVQIHDGRYLVVPGRSGPYLRGRGFIWIDIQDGIGLGAFYFHPVNGEPTPALNVFSKQVQDEPLAMSQLPPAFAEDLRQWSEESMIPPVLTRYFITGANRKILLEHDEDYCAAVAGGQPANNCEEMNANAADLDMNAASYLEQTHHLTNATAWMLTGREQAAWLHVRDDSCGIGPARLPCYIRITHERTHVIIPGWHAPRHFPAPHVPTVHVPATH